MMSNRVHQPVLIQFTSRTAKAVSAPPKRQREASQPVQKEEKKKLRRSFSSLKKSLAPCHRHRIKAMAEKEKAQCNPRRQISGQLGVKTRKPPSKTPKRKSVTFQDMIQANSTFKTPQRLPEIQVARPVQIEELKEEILNLTSTPEIEQIKKNEQNGPRFSPFILRTGRLRPETVQIVDKKKTLSLKHSSSEKSLKSRKKEQLLNLLAIDRVHSKVLDDMISKDSSEFMIEKTLGEKEKNFILFKKLLKEKERTSAHKFRNTQSKHKI